MVILLIAHRVCSDLVISVLDCQLRGLGFKSWLEISVPRVPLTHSAMMNTLTVHCHWEDMEAREWTGRD